MSKLERLREQFEKYKRELREAEREADGKSKYLHGYALLKAMEAEAVKPEYVQQLLDSYIRNKSDRAFLDLPPLAESAPVDEVLNGNGSDDYQPSANQSEFEHPHDYY